MFPETLTGGLGPTGMLGANALGAAQVVKDRHAEKEHRQVNGAVPNGAHGHGRLNGMRHPPPEDAH